MAKLLSFGIPLTPADRAKAIENSEEIKSVEDEAELLSTQASSSHPRADISTNLVEIG